jgi:hypothetical protein
VPTDSDPQRDAVYDAISALTFKGTLPNSGAVRSFLNELGSDLGVAPVDIDLVEEPPLPVASTKPIKSSAFVRNGHRVIYFVKRRAPLTQQIQVLHELAHILTPRPDEPHDPVWARTFVDLVDRFWWVASADLRWELTTRGVQVSELSSEWDDPRSWGLGPFVYPPKR